MTYSQPAPASHTRDSTGRTLAILGIVFGVVAVIFAPILFGPAGIICAAIAMRKGEPLGKTALIVAIAGTVVGLVLAAWVLSAMD